MGYGAILKFLARYWLHIAAAAAVIAGLMWVASLIYGRGVQDERSRWLLKENKALQAAVAERDKAIAERNAAQRKADELAKPQREVAKSAKDNPSGCSLAKPTGDRLREQVRATNDAIRAVP